MSTTDSIDRIVAASNLLIEAGERFGADTPRGFHTFQRVVDAVVERFRRQLPPPEPAPRPERPADWHDEPADFQDEIPIGEICGATIYGLQMWEQKGGQIWRYAARAELNGLQIGCYPPALGDEREYINVNTGDGLDGMGDLHWWEWGALRELATDPSDPIGQLMTAARRFVAEQ
jgi:hypothetical protein